MGTYKPYIAWEQQLQSFRFSGDHNQEQITGLAAEGEGDGDGQKPAFVVAVLELLLLMLLNDLHDKQGHG